MFIIIFAIFKLILSLFSILIIGVYFYYYIRFKNYSKNLSYKRLGITCSRCSNRILTDSEITQEVFEGVEDLSECISCRRDSRLNLLINLSTIKSNFDRWVLTKKSEKVLIFVLIIPFPFLISSLFIENKTFYDVATITNSCIMIAYWSTMIYRLYLCRK